RESRFGNQCLHVTGRPANDVLAVSMAIDATRKANSGGSELLRDEDRALYLSPEPLVPLGGPVKELALEATRRLTVDSDKARAIYNNDGQTSSLGPAQQRGELVEINRLDEMVLEASRARTPELVLIAIAGESDQYSLRGAARSPELRGNLIAVHPR